MYESQPRYGTMNNKPHSTRFHGPSSPKKNPHPTCQTESIPKEAKTPLIEKTNKKKNGKKGKSYANAPFGG